MRSILFFIALTFPISAFAYRLPDRDFWRAYVINRINNSREQYGLIPVGIDDGLSEMSQYHAQDSAMYFDDTSEESRRDTYLAHDSSDGRKLGDRIRDHGIEGLTAGGENVGFRLRGPISELHEFVKEAIDLIHDGMMAEIPPDDGHRETILGNYTHVGVGLELYKNIDSEVNTLFFVTDFGKYGDSREIILPVITGTPAPYVISDNNDNNQEEIADVENPQRPRYRPVGDPISRSYIPEDTEEPEIDPYEGLTRAERIRLRVAERRNARIAGLLERVDERRRIRMLRRFGF